MAFQPLFEKLKGIIGNYFQFDGGDGPQIHNNAGVVEMRNAADDGFVITRGADPADPNDYVTKHWYDEHPAAGAVQLIRFPIGTNATYNSMTEIPDDAYVLQSQVEITTPYSVAATIDVGDETTVDKIQAQTDIRA